MREDDAPAPARAYRGTTSLAAGLDPKTALATAHVSGCDGPDPPGSSQARSAADLAN
jgi:hypothetical protein